MADITEVLKQISDLAEKNGLGVMEIDYYHDDWCPCSDGTRGLVSCVCKPDMKVRRKK